MPYKRLGQKIMVKKRGRWQLLKWHKTVALAEKHLIALKINVPHKE